MLRVGRFKVGQPFINMYVRIVPVDAQRSQLDLNTFFLLFLVLYINLTVASFVLLRSHNFRKKFLLQVLIMYIYKNAS